MTGEIPKRTQRRAVLLLLLHLLALLVLLLFEAKEKTATAHLVAKTA